MHAVDTNVVVRLVTSDDPLQTARAAALFARQDIFVPVTVVLETEWVLRRGYRYSMAQIADAFRAIIGLPGVTVERSDQVFRALDLCEAGMDFADALHFCAMPEGAVFATFDRALHRIATRAGLSVTEP